MLMETTGYVSSRITHILLLTICSQIWRTFKVSGGISIAALADKILLPVMGWSVSAPFGLRACSSPQDPQLPRTCVYNFLQRCNLRSCGLSRVSQCSPVRSNDDLSNQESKTVDMMHDQSVCTTIIVFVDGH